MGEAQRNPPKGESRSHACMDMTESKGEGRSTIQLSLDCTVTGSFALRMTLDGAVYAAGTVTKKSRSRESRDFSGVRI